MAGSFWRPSWTSLTSKAPIVDYIGTRRFHLNCRTALRVRRHFKKEPTLQPRVTIATAIATYSCVHSHAHMTRLDCDQHFAVFWFAVSI